MSTNRNTDVIGHSFIFPPEVIDDIHIKSELGRYRMRGCPNVPALRTPLRALASPQAGCGWNIRTSYQRMFFVL